MLEMNKEMSALRTDVLKDFDALKQDYRLEMANFRKITALEKADVTEEIKALIARNDEQLMSLEHMSQI